MANTFKAGKGFKKSKKTFLESAGRMGAPSARKPMLPKADKARAKNASFAMGKKPAGASAKSYTGKKSSFRTGKKVVTKKAKGVINSFNTAKQPPMPSRGLKDKKTGNFYMSKRPQGGNPKQDSIDKRLGSYFSGIKGGTF